MGRHIGCKHTRDGEAFLNLAEKEMDLEAVQVRIDIFGSPAFEESLDLQITCFFTLTSVKRALITWLRTILLRRRWT